MRKVGEVGDVEAKVGKMGGEGAEKVTIVAVMEMMVEEKKEGVDLVEEGLVVVVKFGGGVTGWEELVAFGGIGEGGDGVGGGEGVGDEGMQGGYEDGAVFVAGVGATEEG